MIKYNSVKHILCVVVVFKCALFTQYAYSLENKFEFSEVEVTGVGSTEKLAIKQALREAVEQVSGVLLLSNTSVQNGKLENDKIETASNGFVSDYKVIDKKNSKDMSSVKISVKIDNMKLKSVYQQTSPRNVFDLNNAVKNAMIAKNKMLQIKESRKLLQIISNKIITSGYYATLDSYNISNIQADFVDVDLSVKIHRNQMLWNAYYNLLNMMSIERVNARWYYESLNGDSHYPTDKLDSRYGYCQSEDKNVFYETYESLAKYCIFPLQVSYITFSSNIGATIPEKKDAYSERNKVAVLKHNDFCYIDHGEFYGDCNDLNEPVILQVRLYDPEQITEIINSVPVLSYDKDSIYHYDSEYYSGDDD